MVRAASWPTEELAGTLFPLVYYCLGFNRFYTVSVYILSPLASQLIKKYAHWKSAGIHINTGQALGQHNQKIGRRRVKVSRLGRGKFSGKISRFHELFGI